MIIKSALLNSIYSTKHDNDEQELSLMSIEIDEEVYEKRKFKVGMIISMLEHAPLENLVEIANEGYANFRQVLLTLIRDLLFLVDDEEFEIIVDSILNDKEEPWIKKILPFLNF